MFKYNVGTYIRLSRDENYTGTLVQGKRRNENYISHEEVKNPEKDWIKTKNHHEAIISKDKFDEVQQILDRKIKVNKNNEIDLFSSYLKCFHCGEHLIIRKSKNKYITIVVLILKIRVV